MQIRKLSLLSVLVLAACTFTASLSAQTIINVTAQGTAGVRNVQIANGSGIEFQNNAAFSVAIKFTTSGGMEFGDIASIASGQHSAFQTGNKNNITVNYSITNLSSGQIRGPYGIEVGTGLLQINVSNDWPDLDTISLPANGEIQFNSDAAYTLTCDAGSLSPNLTSLQPGLNSVQTLEGEFSGCSISSNEPVVGGGSVKIHG